MRARLWAAMIAVGVTVAGGVAFARGLPPFTTSQSATWAVSTDGERQATPTIEPPRPTHRPTLTLAPLPTDIPTPTVRPMTPTPPQRTPTPTTTAPAPETPAPTPTATTQPLPPAVMKLEDRGTQVRELEARLAQLGLLSTEWVDGYFGTATRKAVTSLQARHDLRQLGFVDAATWRVLKDKTREPTRDEMYPPKPTSAPNQPGTLDPRCTTGRAICVDKSTRTLRWVVDGKVRLTMDARFGCKSSPTREGLFRVNAKVRHGYSKFYNTRMPFSLFFSGHQAVHYSDDFAARGYNGCSHGCVNIRDWNKLEKLFNEAKVGDKVVVYWS
jgi:lipoprotein-anchoring transpeptidase ErfK/SrfK